MSASERAISISEAVAAEPVADVLRRVGNELILVATALDNVEVPIHEALLHGAGSRYPPFIQVMQELDHMRQTVACLGEFLNAIAVSIPDKWQLDSGNAASAVTLADLAARLRANGPMASWGQDAGGNDYELF